jgi:hypothetical protein
MRITRSGFPIGISVSHPPDVNENPNNNGWIIETALWDSATSSIVYAEELGYENIQRFVTNNDLLVEIVRILT